MRQPFLILFRPSDYSFARKLKLAPQTLYRISKDAANVVWKNKKLNPTPPNRLGCMDSAKFLLKS